MTEARQPLNRKSLFLRACRSEPVERVPVWIMRQAGRYLPEYRAIRAKHTFLEMCKTPELAVEVSLQPYRNLGVDAVIVFSDILIPAEAMGQGLELTEAGPVLANPIRDVAAVNALRAFDPEQETGFLMEAIRQLRRELGPEVPVLGFAGAPWTLACYMVEGQTKKDFAALKELMYRQPRVLRALLEKIAESTAAYLKAQIAAGATAVQLFDTWAGELSKQDYEEFALPATQFLISELQAGPAPVIYYSKATAHLLDSLAKTGADVLSIDWRIDLADARKRLGNRVALQGNVDPCILLGPEDGVRAAAREAIEKTGGIGHILNLGHGILPSVPVENARAFVEAGQAVALPATAPIAHARTESR
ncbi:MAG: uroporphyrinogen decarboxylase [Acidobacteria bacterium]|nr:uroporphyrinogen decarboxylase [Acidobacteriota bacterium]MCL5286600.1 uroporphyrinogen decarboxylase [Acidobacteriota bacterium]